MLTNKVQRMEKYSFGLSLFNFLVFIYFMNIYCLATIFQALFEILEWINVKDIKNKYLLPVF